MSAPDPEVWVVVCQNDKAHPRWGVDPGGPIVHEQYVKTATRENAMQRAAAMEQFGACRIARLVFDDQAAPPAKARPFRDAATWPPPSSQRPLPRRAASGGRPSSLLTEPGDRMHKDRCVDIARQAAVDCGERHDYMPATDLLASTFQPHRWVIDAMLIATDEAERERDQYRAGNTELLELLMKLHAGQHESLLPRVREILVGAGLVDPDGTLNWAALEARKPKPITWAQAVNECVTDPEARARLLAMGDTA